MGPVLALQSFGRALQHTRAVKVPRASSQTASLRRYARWLCLFVLITILVNIPALCFAFKLGYFYDAPPWLRSFYNPWKFYYIRDESRVVELVDVGVIRVTADSSNWGVRVVDYLRPRTFKWPTGDVLPPGDQYEPTTLYLWPEVRWSFEDAYLCGEIGDADCVSIIAWGWPCPTVRQWRAFFGAHEGTADMLRGYGFSEEQSSGWQPELDRGKQILWLGAIANGVIASTAIALVNYGVLAIRSRRRRRQHSCTRCGYEVLGLSICPECGTTTQ
jgi:hypothetical protein